MAQHLWQLVLFRAAHLNHKVKKNHNKKLLNLLKCAELIRDKFLFICFEGCIHHFC